MIDRFDLAGMTDVNLRSAIAAQCMRRSGRPCWAIRTSSFFRSLPFTA